MAMSFWGGTKSINQLTTSQFQITWAWLYESSISIQLCSGPFPVQLRVSFTLMK